MGVVIQSQIQPPAKGPAVVPAMRPQSPRVAHPNRERLVSFGLFLACTGLLALAAWLSPDPAGHGTHTQLGLPPCGFLERTGMPCLSCGMTTAVTHAAHGQILTAFYTQPFAAALAIVCAVLSLFSGVTTMTGASLAPLFQALIRPMTFIVVGVALLGAWGCKILATLAFG